MADKGKTRYAAGNGSLADSIRDNQQRRLVKVSSGSCASPLRSKQEIQRYQRSIEVGDSNPRWSHGSIAVRTWNSDAESDQAHALRDFTLPTLVQKSWITRVVLVCQG